MQQKEDMRAFFFVLKGEFENFLEFQRKNKEFQLKTNNEI